MLKCERTSVMNFENAIRGARNPMNSWGRMDSGYDEEGNFVLGPNDMSLARRLRKAGSDHRKYVRQIFVSVDITAPLYWWKEYDTYKVATVANSTSTMHKIHSKPFSMDDFSHDHMTPDTLEFMNQMVEYLEKVRSRYLETKSRDDWYNMYFARRNHKLAEWHTFCGWIMTLPYAKELIAAEEENEEA